MSSRPTVYDVAAKAGVSIATVSFAFRQPDRVRASTRETVLTAARGLGYVPSANARGLARGNTGVLGLYSFDLMLSQREAIPTPTLVAEPEVTIDPREFPLYVDEIERGFALECRSTGRALLLASGAPTDTDVADIAGRVDGLAVFPGPHELDSLTTVAERIPVVSFSSALGEGMLNRIYVSNQEGIRLLVEHVVITHGAHRLAFVSDLTMREFEERRIGFAQALKEFDLPAPARDGASGNLLGADWSEGLRELARDRRLPDALICQNDQLACDVLDILTEHGLKAPSDVIVTGFDGVLAGRLSEPRLTSVRQPLESMGRLAVRVLTRQLASPSDPREHFQMPLQLMPRESCGCTARA